MKMRKYPPIIGIILIKTVYKIMATLRREKIINISEGTVQQYQCAYTKEKSIIAAKHTVNELMEKSHQHNLKIRPPFIDF